MQMNIQNARLTILIYANCLFCNPRVVFIIYLLEKGNCAFNQRKANEID